MNEQDYLDIEAYLLGDLPQAERQVVEQRLETDLDFKAAYHDRNELLAHLRADAGEAAFRESLGKIMDQPGPQKAKIVALPTSGGRSKVLLWLAVAASVLLLIIASQMWLSSPSADGDLFVQHTPLSLTERGDTQAFAAQAEAAFNQGQYDDAIDPLREYLQSPTSNQQAKLALGISLMETGQLTEARKIFNTIVNGNDTLAPYGNWYLALMAVRAGDNDAALKLLDRIPASDTYLTKKAEELRKSL